MRETNTIDSLRINEVFSKSAEMLTELLEECYQTAKRDGDFTEELIGLNHQVIGIINFLKVLGEEKLAEYLSQSVINKIQQGLREVRFSRKYNDSLRK